jgi:hypothetical protein
MTISDFEKRNLRVTWTLLSICFDCRTILRNAEDEQSFISGAEIVDYAMDQLAVSDDRKIVALSILDPDDKEQISQSLALISWDEICDYDTEFRKFRAMYVYKNLPSKSDDYLRGILKISELWDKLGFPDDSPNIYYKFKDFSRARFEYLLKINTDWVYKEFEELSKTKI